MTQEKPKPIKWVSGTLHLTIKGIFRRVVTPGELIVDDEELQELGPPRVAELVRVGNAVYLLPGEEAEVELSVKDCGELQEMVRSSYEHSQSIREIARKLKAALKDEYPLMREVAR